MERGDFSLWEKTKRWLWIGSGLSPHDAEARLQAARSRTPEERHERSVRGRLCTGWVGLIAMGDSVAIQFEGSDNLAAPLTVLGSCAIACAGLVAIAKVRDRSVNAARAAAQDATFKEIINTDPQLTQLAAEATQVISEFSNPTDPEA